MIMIIFYLYFILFDIYLLQGLGCPTTPNLSIYWIEHCINTLCQLAS